MVNPAGVYKSGKFIQRKRAFYNSDNGLTNEKANCLLLAGDTLYIGTEKGLFKLKNGKVKESYANVLTGCIKCLYSLSDGKIVVSSGNKIYYIENSKLKLYREFDSEVVDIKEYKNYLWVLTEKSVYCIDKFSEKDKLHRGVEGGKGRCLAVSDENIYVASDTNISIVHGKRMEWKNILPLFSDMPDSKVTALSFDDQGYLWIGFEDCTCIFDNRDLWFTCDNIRSLPKNGAYKIVTDKQGGRYFASDVGIIIQKNGALKYLGAGRWVPDNKINDIAVSDDGMLLYAATDKGISEIKSDYYTLSQKAEYYEDIIEKYHIRRGFTATRFVFSDDISDGKIQISDNDGLWTASYVAAESFRYASTGDKKALEKARRGIKAMIFLTQITGIPGFTARAVRYPGEQNFGDGDSEWALSPDGSCEWKGETSSDEMTGHFFGMSTYYDLCANEKEKKEIRKALLGIMNHIIDNNYRLIDKDGLPTTWACWDPEMLNHADKWFFERGINSLELLAFLKVSYHISGDEKYNNLYNEFVRRYHYPLNVMQHKIRDAHVCHIDDNLGFLAGMMLLRLEENESLRSYYICGMEDHWQYEKVENQPMFAFIHAAFTGRDSDISTGVQSLREIPLDLICYPFDLSGRKDLTIDDEQLEWHEPVQLKYPVGYDETNIHRPDSSVFNISDNISGYACEPTLYLLPYWIARYYNIIEKD